MALRLVPFLFLWALTVANASADPSQPQSRAHVPVERAGRNPDRPLLRETFQAQFSKDELAQFKGQPTIEQLIQRMSPEQRQGARGRLGKLERGAATPEELKEIARGYLMLDEKAAPNPGEGAVRVATRLRELEPEKTEGFALTASGIAGNALVTSGAKAAGVATTLVAGAAVYDQVSYSKSQGQQPGGSTATGQSTTEPPRGESASPNAKDSLDRKLRALEQAQKDAEHVRNLPDGRVRYYGPEKPAQTQGPTRGRRMVTEFDSKTGQVRQWMENYDHSGKIVRVRPKMIDGQVVESQHYPPTGKELAP